MEELKIIITAVNASAKKAIKEVTAELEKVDQEAKKGKKSFGDAMKSIAKGATIAVGAIAAVVTALVAFGRSTIAVQKEIARLNSAFEASGRSAKQAGETYKSIFGFLGDSGAAVEAAQQLAYIPTDDIKAYEKILQGVYATFGTSIETGGLAEAINHTIQLGEVQGTLSDAFEFAGVSVDSVNAKLETFNSATEREAYLRSTLLNMYSASADIYARNNEALIANNQSQANLNIALARAGSAILPLMTTINNLATSLLSVLSPAIAIVSQMLAILIGWIRTAVGWISSFFSLFSGGKSATKEVANSVSSVGSGAKAAAGGVGGLNKALDGASKAAKELKKQTMGFDELNIVSKQDAATGGMGGVGSGGAITVPDMSDLTAGLPSMDDFSKQLEDAKGKAEALLVVIGSIGLAIGLWKIADFLKDADSVKAAMETIGSKLKTIGGIAMIVAGAILLIQGYTDAWVNGLDWGNFAMILAGIGLTVGGLALAFGPVAAGVGMVAGGIALLVLGIKDLVQNGFSMQGMLSVVAGVILVCVGAVLAFNAALLANPITWVVIAIAALVAAIIVCIVYWDDVKAAAVNAWNKIKEIWEKVAAWFNEKVIQPTVKFFVNLWNDIEKGFKNAWGFVSGIMSTIGNWVNEKVIQPVSKFFKSLWDGFKNSASSAWEAVKSIFSKVADFFGDIFTKAWEKVKAVFSVGGKIFDGIKDGIVNGFKTIVNAIITGINKVVSVPFNAINSVLRKMNGIEILGVKPFSWVQTFSVPQIPKLARGGIIDGATLAMIGEQGKEAVVPLENNTEWIDKLASRLSDTKGAPSKIILQLDGKALGEATINSINDITKQTGALQLVLA